MKKKILAIFAALALALSFLTACGGDGGPAPAPAPSAPEEPAPPPSGGSSGPQSDEGREPPSEPSPAPAGTEPAAEEQGTVSVQPDEPAPEPSEPPETGAEAEPEPEPEPEPDAEPEPEAGVPLADGTYTVSVTLEGGTGRATVESPAVLRCEGGGYWAVIVWSSPNFDYMKVDGQRYDQINTEGNSTFEIPVSAFDQPLPVIADTVAMSEPHEVEYTMTFDSASIQSA